MTTGVINKRWLELRGSTRIIELTIQGFCPVLKVQTVREPGSSIQSLVTKAGLCGGNEGTELDVAELPSRLERVTIRSSSAIDSIEFSYVDQSGRRCTEGPWGGDGGTAHPVSFLFCPFLIVNSFIIHLKMTALALSICDESVFLFMYVCRWISAPTSSSRNFLEHSTASTISFA